jgi:hypothetical protein
LLTPPLLSNRAPVRVPLSPRSPKGKTASLTVGTKVDVLHGSKDIWYPAVITAESGNAYYDLESEHDVPKSHVHFSMLRISHSGRKAKRVNSNEQMMSRAGFSVGDKVEANYKSKGTWYLATIWKVHVIHDGTLRFDMDYESGVRELFVPESHIRIVSTGLKGLRGFKSGKVINLLLYVSFDYSV